MAAKHSNRARCADAKARCIQAVRDNPGCTSIQIASALGIATGVAKSLLSAVELFTGEVRSQRQAGSRSLRLWFSVPEHISRAYRERRAAGDAAVLDLPTTDINADPCEGVEFREIPSYPGYRVGSDGSVWTCKVRRSTGDGFARWVPAGSWRLLSIREDRHGYKKTHLSHGKRKRLAFVHHLVLLAFVGPKPEGYVGCHGNGDKSDNRIENLRWGTIRDNWEDTIKHGRLRRGIASPHAKLKESDVLAIVELSRRGYSLARLGKWFSVTPQNIKSIVAGQSWSHITGIRRK